MLTSFITSPRSFPDDWRIESGIKGSTNAEEDAKLPFSDEAELEFGDVADGFIN